jgi:hypothetical protein
MSLFEIDNISTSCKIADDADITKKINLNLTGLTTNTTISLQVPTVNTKLIGNNTTDNITNKTIDASTNTITNIDNNDVKNNANINANKISSGTMTNTQYDYLANLSATTIILGMRNWTFDAVNATTISTNDNYITFSQFYFNGTNNNDNITSNSSLIVYSKSFIGTAFVLINVPKTNPVFTCKFSIFMFGSNTYFRDTTPEISGTLPTTVSLSEILVKTGFEYSKFSIAQLVLV